MHHKNNYRGSFLARTLASNFSPFLATYSASLSMTGWMSGGGGMMAGSAGVETGASTLELYWEKMWTCKASQQRATWQFDSVFSFSKKAFFNSIQMLDKKKMIFIKLIPDFWYVHSSSSSWGGNLWGSCSLWCHGDSYSRC